MGHSQTCGQKNPILLLILSEFCWSKACHECKEVINSFLLSWEQHAYFLLFVFPVISCGDPTGLKISQVCTHITLLAVDLIADGSVLRPFSRQWLYWGTSGTSTTHRNLGVGVSCFASMVSKQKWMQKAEWYISKEALCLFAKSILLLENHYAIDGVSSSLVYRYSYIFFCAKLPLMASSWCHWLCLGLSLRIAIL